MGPASVAAQCAESGSSASSSPGHPRVCSTSTTSTARASRCSSCAVSVTWRGWWPSRSGAPTAGSTGSRYGSRSSVGGTRRLRGVGSCSRGGSARSRSAAVPGLSREFYSVDIDIFTSDRFTPSLRALSFKRSSRAALRSSRPGSVSSSPRVFSEMISATASWV